MDVSIETLEGLQRKMLVIIPSSRVEERVNEKLEEAAKTARINGFRPGKVPKREIKRRYGKSIREEVSSEIIQSSFSEAVEREDVNPAGMPKIEDVKMLEDQNLEYSAIFEVFPEVKLSSFDSIAVEKLEAEIREEDLDEMVEKVREQRMEYETAEKSAEDKDKVNIDFEGSIDGEVFEGGKAQGADLILGSGQMIPGFEGGIVGMKQGEEKDVKVTFPEKYQKAELAGKEAIFKIKVNSVSGPKLPELDAPFFESFGLKGSNDLDTFRKELKGNMQKELDNAIKLKVKEQVMDGLLAIHDLSVPKALVTEEAARMRSQMVQQYGGGMKIEPDMLPPEMFSEQAEKRVKSSLVLGAVVEKYKLVVDEEKTTELIDKIAEDYDDPDQVKNYYRSNEKELSQVKYVALEDMVVDLVLESAEVTIKDVSYSEAVARDAIQSDNGGSGQEQNQAVGEEPE
ncbi:MAG: trigger factor [Gammaproteobacteria bacterium]|nr:trigger factor [Gammaproteobacteria bacterium]